MQYKTVNPATGELVATFESISDADLATALTTAHSTYEKDWRHRPVAERAAILKAAARELRAGDEYARYLTLEVGKLVGEAEAEVELAASILDYYADHGEQFLAPKELPEAPGAVVYTEPIGIIFGIEPWNFPYYQVARVAAAQLMAGNVMLVKHAESVPHSALALQHLFERAGAPTGAYTNVFATHDQVGRIIDDPRIAGVTLTGSERAGEVVAERAGRNLKKVVMELGGSDPLILLEDGDLARSVQSALGARMINTGQTCVSTKRIIVVGEERGEQFLEAFRKGLDTFTAGDPADRATTLGPLASQRSLHFLTDQVENARKHGATVLQGGNRIDRPGFYFEPTILTGIDESNPAYLEEFFGPVAAFYVVDTEEEAIALANTTPFGLGAAVFTEDLDRARAVAARIEAGMVFINRPPWTAPQIPFGGVKRSGFGRELSEYGFGEFVNRKLVSLAPEEPALG
ncbi:NAD-dependent succinate-semialdehyde dehydrogenase [Streptomyces edwardsiae]|uniref:NAD-dependent succinate-semialdehyde dehydrogenase n=1 Tax=Streptomyces edwardsiae TaxID=3075527 RepID=A0ABU2QLD2_9ACTN|nr:NAD-dependent succinate-semialdehyde dehydrogenase [Streptomyces sp. DSM 41635]MDT0405279.1 NAD-dependent succinate-semialdehyde dehydrogenase [Streptomyces sp. DSM 41635]